MQLLSFSIAWGWSPVGLKFEFNLNKSLLFIIIISNIKKGENMDLLSKLNEKIDSLLSKYEALKEENAKLNNEIANLKQQLEEKDFELSECKEQMALKEIELEEVLAKIESILGK